MHLLLEAAARAADAARPWRSSAFTALDMHTCCHVQPEFAVAAAPPFLHAGATISSALHRRDLSLAAAAPVHSYAIPLARRLSLHAAPVRWLKPFYGPLLYLGNVCTPSASVYVKGSVSARRCFSYFRRIARLPLDATLRQNLRCMQISHLTQVQDVTFFSILLGRDVITVARSGTGKTLAYLLPLLQRLLDTGALFMCGGPRPHIPESVSPRRRGTEDCGGGKREKWQQPVQSNELFLSNVCDYTSVRAPFVGGAPAAIILVPTRELCQQVAHTVLCLLPSLSVVVADSGTALQLQEQQLAAGPVDVVVGTPSRCLLLQQRGDLHFNSVRCIVLDEADYLLSEGYADKVGHLLELNGYLGWTALSRSSLHTDKQRNNPASDNNAGKACGESRSIILDKSAEYREGNCITDAGKSTITATGGHAAEARGKAVAKMSNSRGQCTNRGVTGARVPHLSPSQTEEGQDEEERQQHGSSNYRGFPATQLILFSSLMSRDMMEAIKARLPNALVVTLLKNKKGKILSGGFISKKVLLEKEDKHELLKWKVLPEAVNAPL